MMNKWITILVTIIAAGAASGAVKWAMKPSMDAKVEEAVQKAVALSRPTLPQKVDERTTWVAMEAVGKTAIYVYRIDVNSSNATEKGKSEFLMTQKKQLVDKACSETHMRTAMDKGGAGYTYIYRDNQNSMIGIIEIKKNDCVV
jgi:hypothetical protein